VEGSDLCSKCAKREEKYNADPKPCDWTGRVTEEPLDWVHMLGTTWAEEKKPKFLGIGDTQSVGQQSVSAAASDAGSVVEEEPVVVAAPVAKKADKAAAKEAAAAAKAAEKEAAAAAKAAEKEAAAAAKKAAADAAKEAKTAEKVAKKAEKPAAAKKATKKAEAKVAPAAEPVTTGDLTLIDGTMYMVKNGNVYEYDELTEKAGDFVGRLTGDETIDTEAEEVVAAESDTD
jgi:hypothetical protein